MVDDKSTEPPADPPADPPQDLPPQNNSMLDKATDLVKKIEKGNDRLEKLLDRKEALQVEKTLGGVADVGQQPPKEESASDYTKRVMTGEEVEKD